MLANFSRFAGTVSLGLLSIGSVGCSCGDSDTAGSLSSFDAGADARPGLQPMGGSGGTTSLPDAGSQGTSGTSGTSGFIPDSGALADTGVIDTGILADAGSTVDAGILADTGTMVSDAASSSDAVGPTAPDADIFDCGDVPTLFRLEPSTMAQELQSTELFPKSQVGVSWTLNVSPLDIPYISGIQFRYPDENGATVTEQGIAPALAFSLYEAGAAYDVEARLQYANGYTGSGLDCPPGNGLWSPVTLTTRSDIITAIHMPLAEDNGVLVTAIDSDFGDTTASVLEFNDGTSSNGNFWLNPGIRLHRNANPNEADRWIVSNVARNTWYPGANQSVTFIGMLETLSPNDNQKVMALNGSFGITTSTGGQGLNMYFQTDQGVSTISSTASLNNVHTVIGSHDGISSMFLNIDGQSNTGTYSGGIPTQGNGLFSVGIEANDMLSHSPIDHLTYNPWGGRIYEFAWLYGPAGVSVPQVQIDSLNCAVNYPGIIQPGLTVASNGIFIANSGC